MTMLGKRWIITTIIAPILVAVVVAFIYSATSTTSTPTWAAQMTQVAMTANHAVRQWNEQTLTPMFNDAAEYAEIWCDAANDTVYDTGRALSSITRLCYYTFRPVVLFGFFCIRGILSFLYEYVIVRGILSPTAIQNIKRLFWKFIDWQRSLSPQQILYEVCGVVGVILEYNVVKFLQRRQYLRRFKRRIQYHQHQLSQSYQRTVQSVTVVSVSLALMVPHGLYLCLCAALKILLPSVVAWFATETKFNSLVSTLLPLLATVWLIAQHYQSTTSTNEIQGESGAANATGATTDVNDTSISQSSDLKRARKKSSVEPKELQKHSRTKKKNQAFPRTSPPATRPRSGISDHGEHGDPTSEPDNTEQTNHARFHTMLLSWIVLGGVTLIKQLYRTVPFSSRFLRAYPFFMSGLAQIEMAFWIWIFVVPNFFTPASIQRLSSYKSPTELIVDHLVHPVVTSMYNAFSSVIPESTWQSYVVKPSQGALDAAVWARVISVPMRHFLTECVQQGRTLLLPTILLVSMMWPLSSLALLSIMYIIPLAHCCTIIAFMKDFKATSNGNPNDKEAMYITCVRWLQFWVLHTLLSCIMALFHNFLVWIPLASLALGCAFALLISLTTTTSTGFDIGSLYYNCVQRELWALGIISRTDDDDINVRNAALEESKLMRLAHYIFDRIPKAAPNVDEDVQEEEDQDGVRDDDNDAPLQQHNMRGAEDTMNGTMDDDDNDDGDQNSAVVPLHQQNGLGQTLNRSTVDATACLRNINNKGNVAEATTNPSAKYGNKKEGLRKQPVRHAQTKLKSDDHDASVGSSSSSSNSSSGSSFAKDTASSRTRRRNPRRNEKTVVQHS